MLSPSHNEVEQREEIAPELTTFSNYTLKFGNNKDLAITKDVKLVEAHLHTV